jgi:signal peptidase II
LTEPARNRGEVRVGSASHGLAPVSVVERPLGATPLQWSGLAAVAGAAFAADQLTKWLVRSRLALGDAVDVAGPLTIHHVRNSGIAFGLFASATAGVILITTVAVAWMLWFFWRAGARHPVLPAALGLVVGGSVANLFDRVRLGHVTDFLDVRWWPAFNLADTFIVVGVAILFLALALGDSKPKPPAPRVPEAIRS